MAKRAAMLDAMGGERGCKKLSVDFYARVSKDPVLRPLFPGKSLKCAIEEFAAFLIQFLGGDEEQTQRRWWLNLRESHARFKIDAAQREAWLNQMDAALRASPIDTAAQSALRDFFEKSSFYAIGGTPDTPVHDELADRWNEQRALDNTIGAVAEGRDDEAIAAAPRFAFRPSVFVGLLARMVKTGRKPLIDFAKNAVERDAALTRQRFGGRALIHFAAGAGRIEVVAALLEQGADPNLLDARGHTPLYRVANECQAGSEIVRMLVRAGADVNACAGVTRSTPLHMAARRGFVEVAQTLIACGAATGVRDRKGDTPLDRAIHCRKDAIVKLLGRLPAE